MTWACMAAYSGCICNFSGVFPVTFEPQKHETEGVHFNQIIRVSKLKLTVVVQRGKITKVLLTHQNRNQFQLESILISGLCVSECDSR